MTFSFILLLKSSLQVKKVEYKINFKPIKSKIHHFEIKFNYELWTN